MRLPSFEHSVVRPATLALLLLANPLGAQTPDSVATARDTAPGALALAPIVATASRLPARADRLGVSVSVLSGEDLRRQAPFQVYDALRTLPGFFLDESVGPGGPTVIRLRGGEETYTQVRVDGVEINQRGGFFDLRGLGLSGVDRLEVGRGPQSAAYGTSAVNGVVQFLTAPGTPGPTRVEATLEGGGATENDELGRGEIRVRGGSERFRYSLAGGGSYDRGIWDLPNDTWTADGVARLDAAPTDQWLLRATGRFIRTASHLPVRDPGASRVPLDPNARDEKDRVISSVQAVYRPSERWSHTLSLTAFNEDGLYRDQRDDITPPEGIFVFDFDFGLRSDFWRTGVEWSTTWDGRRGQGQRGVAVTAGARWEREDLHTEQTGDFGDGVVDLDRALTAGYAELQAGLGPRWDVLVGARVDDFQGLDAELSPRIGGTFHALPGRLDVRAAAGRAFKAPNLERQFPNLDFIASNPDLGPETAVSWEAGADVWLAEGRLRTSLTFFQQRFDDLIRTVPLEGDDMSRSINVNLGRSHARGVEWLVRGQVRPHVSLGAEGAWTATEMIDNRGLGEDQYPEGEELPFRPHTQGSVFLELDGAGGFGGILRGTWVGRQVVLSERFSGRRETLHPYLVVGLTARYRLSPRGEVYARLENLFDREYLTAFDRPGVPPRGAVGVRLRVR